MLREESPSGITTQRFYEKGRLMSLWVGSSATNYLYTAAQGERMAAKQSPSGEWEVYCYRVGATLSDCTGGTLSENLQWKARIAGDARVPPWNIIERTEYTYRPKFGAVGLGGGLKTRELVERQATGGRAPSLLTRRTGLSYDALDRVTSSGPENASGTRLYSAQKAYDANDNLIGEAPGFLAAPAACGGLDPSDADSVTSTQCYRSDFDRLDRVTRIDAAGNLASHELFYDVAGHLKQVTAPRGDLVRYETDDFGNVVTVAGQWSNYQPIRQTFDASGNLRFRRTPHFEGAPGVRALEYRYDALKRPTAAFAPAFEGEPVRQLWAIGYDGLTAAPTGCPEPLRILKGRPQWKDDSFGRSWFAYDGEGNMSAIRRVRASASSSDCGSLSAESSQAHPDSSFTYDKNRLTEMKYPHGLRVRYEYGDAGRQSEVVRVLFSRDEGPFTPLIDSIEYDVGGELRRYRMRNDVTVETVRAGPVTLPIARCLPQAPSDDGSGRVSMLRVMRRNQSLMTRVYGWNADQLSGQATCWMDDAQPTNELFSFDAMGQVVSASRPQPARSVVNSGPYTELGYQYEFGSDRTKSNSSGDWWAYEYDANGRMTFQRPRLTSTGTAQSSWVQREFYFDADGRVQALFDSPTRGNRPETDDFHYAKELQLRPDNGYGGVFKEVRVNGGYYQYFYDAQGRRRLKVYPTGRSDEFFYDGDRMLEDVGNVSTSRAAGKVLDSYIYLGNLPVAVVRASLGEDEAPSAKQPSCNRNGEAQTCGLFFIVNDYLPKPVALISDSGELAGIMEYDVFGQVNTVSMRRDVPANPSAQEPFAPYQPALLVNLASFAAPAHTGMRAQARVNYAFVNTATDGDKTWVSSGAGCSTALTPQYTGVRNAFATPWLEVGASPLCVRWTAAGSGWGGAATTSYEYRFAEKSYRAVPASVPLRFPGQYADAETGFFENWNRYYDPKVGRYLSSEPVHQLPTEFQKLVSTTPLYSYARGSPVQVVDLGGEKPGDIFKKAKFNGKELTGADLAAIDAANYIREQWPYDSYVHEYGTIILEVKPGEFTYVQPRTDHNEGSVVMPEHIGNERLVGALHTHPIGGNPGFSGFGGDTDNYGPTNGRVGYLLRSDGAILKAEMRDGYVPDGVPQGPDAFKGEQTKAGKKWPQVRAAQIKKQKETRK